MVLKVSQEVFDDAVQENIEVLGLEPEEALQEAVAQFQAQGADLSAVVKELMISQAESKKIEENVQLLNELNKGKAEDDKLLQVLNSIKDECDKGLQNRVAVAKAGAYDAILDTITSYSTHDIVQKTCLRALLSLMTKQPDLLDDRGVAVIISNLKHEMDYDVKRLTLKWSKECCVMHEMNRQKLFDANILDNLKELLAEGNSDILKEVLSVCRALVLDDDVRVEFGRAHEHARMIASETLCSLTGLLSRFRTDESLINDLMLTLSALMVRTEFCKKVEDAGGLELIKDVMNGFPSSQKISKQCFKLLKSLAGNDDCKAHIIQKGLQHSIVAALNGNKENAQTATAGLSSIAALTLRSPENSKAFFEAGAPAVMVNVMKIHSNEKSVQKSAGWAIRNMVSRSRYQNDTFLELGVEEQLKKAMKQFSDIEYDLKAALRDLECSVQLKEEWTGKGGALTTEQTKTKE